MPGTGLGTGDTSDKGGCYIHGAFRGEDRQ